MTSYKETPRSTIAERSKPIVTWIPVLLNSSFACLWAYWGILENFHEGWYYETLRSNLLLMLGQYLLFALLFVFLGIVSVQWPKTGGLLFMVAAAIVPFRFNTSAALIIVSLPMFITGLFYYINPSPRNGIARILVVGFPVVLLVSLSIEPIHRISNRSQAYSPESITVVNPQREMTWAPEGPGWPGSTAELTYRNWDDVVRTCAHLSEDGKTLSATELNLWRLPAVEEVVQSLTRNGSNAGGTWNSISQEAQYRIKPDKEPPLWKVHSPIIYWWTATEVDDSTVLRIVYNGTTQKVSKKLKMGSLGFRAVKNTDLK